jgi:hypothetical protein
MDKIAANIDYRNLRSLEQDYESLRKASISYQDDNLKIKDIIKSIKLVIKKSCKALNDLKQDKHVGKKSEFESSYERLLKLLAYEIKEENFKTEHIKEYIEIFNLLHRYEKTTQFKIFTYSILLGTLKNENILKKFDKKHLAELVESLKVKIETNFLDPRKEPANKDKGAQNGEDDYIYLNNNYYNEICSTWRFCIEYIVEMLFEDFVQYFLLIQELFE